MGEAARRACLASDLGTTEIDILAINILHQKPSSTAPSALIDRGGLRLGASLVA